jgi:hypothetical protein
VTVPMMTFCPAYFRGLAIAGQCFTSMKVPQSSVCPVKRFMNDA